jgi:hypothetical protein
MDYRNLNFYKRFTFDGDQTNEGKFTLWIQNNMVLKLRLVHYIGGGINA